MGIVWEGIVRVATDLGGNCPEGNCPRVIVLGGNCPGGNCLGENCPVPFT